MPSPNPKADVAKIFNRELQHRESLRSHIGIVRFLAPSDSDPRSQGSSLDATDLPAQALAYRRRYLTFQQARQSAPGLDIRDIHRTMLEKGTVPLPRMRERVADGTR
ncbi:hypothetical protein D5S18_29955 [Nocardia panacis]|uniref:Uncharacterized protein n=1 Tax=Nocardia panacis TaxID=2340916 RepID=A0A3A4KLC1_9NOCA|nr:hypothetical protein [Nocardia panacis]RJO70079.1 hypothetical protein D5S18_29955 [Nocardia panacis]